MKTPRWLAWLWRRYKRWRGPKPKQTAVGSGASLYVSAEGINAPGWLSPDGQFVTFKPTTGQLHREVAESIVGAVANPERELEQAGWVKFSSGRYFTGWHAQSKLTERQRLVIQDWYVRNNRRNWPDWLLE